LSFLEDTGFLELDEDDEGFDSEDLAAVVLDPLDLTDLGFAASISSLR
jgi:hypothetical protein